MTKMTIKQILAASKLVENGGNIGRAMIAAGYSPNTAKTPQKLTRSRGWKELMDEAFPDELLLKSLKRLLGAKKIYIIRENGQDTITRVIDAPVVIKALDMVYKIKGLYPSKKTFVPSEPKIIKIIRPWQVM